MIEPGDQVIKKIKTEQKYGGLKSLNQYNQLYKESIDNNEEFWSKQAKRIDWFEEFTKVKNCKYSSSDVVIQWFYDGKLNVCYNCVDRHILNGKQDQIALIWEKNDPKYSQHITYQQLYENVCQLSNGLLSLGVQKGDVVSIYMPMIPEIAYAMLACARIGAVHNVIFGGFSADSISKRIDDCKSQIIITADESLRGPKVISLKTVVDNAIQLCHQTIKKVIVVQTNQKQIQLNPIDIFYHDLCPQQAKECKCAVMNAEDPLFILYTSGSTGPPKGVLHTSGGYLVYASMTHQYIFDYQPGDIYWCTADCGWITGHSYLIYGPLSNCATSLMYEGVPNWPTPSRIWQIVDKHQVSQLYTSPTAIRTLMKEGNQFVLETSRKSLRILGTVGEPINPEAWNWYFNVVGDSRCPIVDTWWQTETGGVLITPLPGVTPLKPGSATLPFLGVRPVIVDDQGKELLGECTGQLCIAQSWPGQMRSVYGNHERFIKTYFSQFDGKYFTGDGCKRDSDGYYWITGRVDDIIIVSGHNIGSAELESVLVSHLSIAEAAVVGIPHEIKGSSIYCFVTAKTGVETNDNLRKELIAQIRSAIGPFAMPDHIQFADCLPKTRSGKIMRRILKKIAENDFDNLGDISTLGDPSVVQDLIDNRKK